MEELLRELARTDRRGAVWCAALCALTVQHLVLAGEHAPATALRLAMLWAQGVPVSQDRMQSSADDVSNARIGMTSEHAVSAAAIDAAAEVAMVAYTGGSTAAACAVHATTLAYAYACRNVSIEWCFEDWEIHRAEHRELLAELVDHQLTPLPHPGHSPLSDWLLERGFKAGRVGTLGDSLAWARRHRLRWWVPAQRWAAEHRIVPPRDLILAEVS